MSIRGRDFRRDSRRNLCVSCPESAARSQLLAGAFFPVIAGAPGSRRVRRVRYCPRIWLPERRPQGQHSTVRSEIEATRHVLETDGPGSLLIDDLRPEDLPNLAWSGNPTHLRSVAGYLDRIPAGEVEYLAVRGVEGTPVAKVGIEYTEAPGLGTVMQLATHPDLQGLGLARALLAAAEERIRRRGLGVVRLGVGDDNPRARALYERLGYHPVGRREVSWEAEHADGSLFMYTTTITELDKPLDSAGS